MFKFVLLVAAISAIQAQYITPTITSQNSNVYRTLGNLGQVSTYSKTIDTPYSSVSKSDVRVSNPGIHTIGGLGLPSTLGGVHYPVGFHAPYGVASPRLAHTAILPGAVPVGRAVASPALLGVAYSVAPSVSHMTYSNGLGLSYAW